MIRRVKMIGSSVGRSISTTLIAAWVLGCAATSLSADKIRISGGGMTPLHSIIWVANQEGMFKQYGLEAEYLVMNSGTLGVQTLLSNESQFLFSTGALAISANLQGADLAIITGGFNSFAFKVVARSGIKNPQDLRGKKISISQFGSATDFAIQATLQKFGVDPKQATIIQLGPSSSRLTSLINGSTDASLFSEPFATMAIKKHKMNLLLDMAEAGMAFPQSCLMIKRSYLDAHREQASNVVKALIEGLFLAKRDKALMIQVMKKYIRADDEVYGIGYDYFLGKYADGLLSMPDRRGLELVIAQSARTNAKAKGQTPESLKLLEPAILDDLKKSGFVDGLRR